MTERAEQSFDPTNSTSNGPGRPLGRSQLIAIFFFGALLFLLYQLYVVFSPFISAIAWGAILVMIFYPVHDWIVRRFGGRTALASACTTFLVFLTVILPGIIFIETLATQMLDIYRSASSSSTGGALDLAAAKFKQTPFAALWDRIKEIAQFYAIDLQSIVLEAAKSLSVSLAGELRSALKNIFISVLSFLMMVISLFFFFRDGEKLYRVIHGLIPMEESHKDVVFAKFYETVSAVVRGLLVTAAVQGVLGGVAYAILGAPYPTFLGFLTALFAIVPFLGAASIWLPTSLYLMLTGIVGKGIILLVWGLAVVSTVDNVLKPILIGSRTNIPSLFLFFSILGGLQAYGLLGLFLGPVLLAILIAFLDIYQEVYHHRND